MPQPNSTLRNLTLPFAYPATPSTNFSAQFLLEPSSL